MRDKKLEIYCDIDNVVYGFAEIVLDLYNKATNSNEIEASDWWFSNCNKVDKSWFEDLMLKEGLILHGKPIKDSIKTLTKLYNECYKIKFISSPEWNHKKFSYERCMWLLAHVPFFKEDMLILTKDKSVCAKPNRILIDDSIENLQSFTKEGGISICYAQNWNKEYKGLRCDNWSQIYDLIHTIDNE